jgi:PadR family transcriptional regulator PadR
LEAPVQEPATSSGSSDHLARFSFAPPRHFALPAVLLLLSEEPNYGYELVKGLRAFRFGDVDRPAVYRALAQLEKDGLVESWSAESKAGQARRVYDLTDDGRRALRTWMGVVKEERDGLDRVLRRYRATGTADALLAEAEAGWGLAAGATPASASLTNGLEARMAARSISRVAPLPVIREDAAPGPAIDRTSRFIVVPERSAVLVEARSTVGPITFGALGITGFVECQTTGHGISPGEHTRARLEVPVEQLRSGNGLYDAELLRRIDARRFPIAALELVGCTPVGDAGR